MRHQETIKRFVFIQIIEVTVTGGGWGQRCKFAKKVDETSLKINAERFFVGYSMFDLWLKSSVTNFCMKLEEQIMQQ